MRKDILISLLFSVALIGGTLYLISNKPAPPTTQDTKQIQNVEVKDGVQYVTVYADGGYSPRVSEVQGGIPTKLIIKTNNTYDCSAALVIRSVGFQKILPPTGEEIIDLGILKSDQKIQGVCSMGMYSFQIQVKG